MVTAQDVIDLSREPLNDDDKSRWSDGELFKYFIVGYDELRKARPDLFIGSMTQPAAALSLSSPVLVPAKQQGQLADYITARALMKDSESGSTTKAAAFVQMGARP